MQRHHTWTIQARRLQRAYAKLKLPYKILQTKPDLQGQFPRPWVESGHFPSDPVVSRSWSEFRLGPRELQVTKARTTQPPPGSLSKGEGTDVQLPRL